MNRFLSAVMSPMRVVRDALPRAVRVGIVVVLIFAFDIVFPDMGRVVQLTNAATVGTGICKQTVNTDANVVVTTSGNVCTVSFNSSNSWTAPTGISSMNVLVVGGGGGGGGGSTYTVDGYRGGGGGGGGGAVNSATSVSFPAGGSFAVTVGAGGSGGAANNNNGGFGLTGSAGGTSSLSATNFSTLTASGGGGGGVQSGEGVSLSGGDGGNSSSTVNGSTTNRSGGLNNYEGAGGGAGSGADGVNGTDIGGTGGNGGNGGAGLSVAIGGTTANYGGGGGGGGTKGADGTTGTAGSGGSGGGGNGGILGTNAVVGTANLGGGGGGGGGYRNGTYPATSGAAGGSGTVVISYIESAPTVTARSVNAAGNALTLTFSEPMSATTPAASAFAVTNAGIVNPVTSVTASGSTLVLALREPVYAGQAVTVAYTDPTAGDDLVAAQDNAGFDVASFAATAATNSATSDIPRAARLIGLGTQTTVNLSGVSGNIRGITSDGEKIFFRLSNDYSKMWEVPSSNIVANPGSSRTVTPTSWSITNAPSATDPTQLAYSSGCIFLLDASSVLKCIDTSTRSASSISVPAAKPFPAGRNWMSGNLVSFPDGRIGKLGAHGSGGTSNSTLLRVYSVSGTGSAATLTWSSDYFLNDITSAWPDDDHGAVSDGTYVYRVRHANGYKVWRLFADGDSQIAFNGDGSGACGASGTLCSISQGLSNATYVSRDHVWGRILVGDYDGQRFYITEATSAQLAVTYDSQGGSAIGSGTTVTGGTISSSPGTPTRTGYSFAGWYTAATGGSAVTFPYAHGRTQDFTLFARWTANNYAVTFDSQSGSAISPVNWEYGTSLTLPTPTRPGYTFQGWSRTAAGSQKVYETTTASRVGNNIVYATGFGKGASDAAATLKSQGTTFDRVRYRMEAVYSGTTYYADVSFDKWNGATIDTLAIPDVTDARVIQTNVANMSIMSNWPGIANTAEAVVAGSGKAGRLELWPYNYSQATSAAGLQPVGSASSFDYDDSSAGSSDYGSFQVHNITDRKTVFAWNRHSAVEVPDIGFGNFIGYSAYDNSRNPDWTFTRNTVFSKTGWKLQIFIGDLLLGGSTSTPTDVAPFTLYAQWVPNSSTVTYNYNNATSGNTRVSDTFTTGDSALTLPSPARTGYVFGGWYSDAGFTTSIGDAGASYTPASTVTAYAKWLRQLTVTYNSQLGSSISAGSTVEEGSIASSPGTPTRANYDFKGWFTAASGGSALTFPYVHGQTANFTLYAQWITNQTGFTITNAPTSLAYLATRSLGTTGGNGGGAVTFATTSPTVCSVNAGTGLVTMLEPSGTCNIAATKAADSDYYATSTNVSFTAIKANQSALSITGATTGAYGATVSLSTTGGSTNGALTWSHGASNSCTVNSSGTVTMTASSGTCSVTVSMAGNANYESVTSSAFSIAATKANQSTLTVSTTTATYGETLSLAATGGSTSGDITWSVTSGTCTVSGNTLTVGNAGSVCVVRATRAGDTNYNAVNSALTTITIDKTWQAALVVTSTTATYGASLSLTSSGGSGDGSVTWNVINGDCAINSGVLTPSDAGSVCIVRATKATSTNYNAVNSADTSITIQRATQAALVVSSLSVTYGQTLSLTTSGGSGGGVVSWQVVSGTCTISFVTLTPGDAGSSCVIRATKAQSTNYTAVDSSDTSITISRANQSTLTVATSTVPYGRSTALTTSGGSGTGDVTFTVMSGTCTISAGTASLTPGNVGSSCVVRATRASDTNYNAVNSANASITISKGSQTGLSITSDSNFETGSTLALTASGGQSGGSLSWAVVSGPCSVTGSSLTSPKGGVSCTVEVTRAGDANYLASSESVAVSVTKIAQVLTFQSNPASPTRVGDTYTVTVSSSAFLAPVLAVANQSRTVCSLSAGIVSFTTTGACVLTASQAGSDVYTTASASQTITVIAVDAVASTTSTTVASVGQNNVAPAAPTTVAPTTTMATQTGIATAATTTTTSTTTTTTTTVPADPTVAQFDKNGQPIEVQAGDTVAFVRGEKVAVVIEQVDGYVQMSLQNGVKIRIGASSKGSSSATVSSDGVLRVFREDEVEVSISGLVPGTTYTFFMFSQPIELGRGIADASGSISTMIAVPKNVEVGDHTLQVNGVGRGGEMVSMSLGFKVLQRESNTWVAVLAISLAMLLALLGGRPIFTRRRRRS